MSRKERLFRVKAEYRVTVLTDVEAEDESEAERKALPELDETAAMNLTCYSLRVEERCKTH